MKVRSKVSVIALRLCVRYLPFSIVVIVELMPQTYTVSEDVGSVSVCITLTGRKVTEFSIPVVVNTTDISAVGECYINTL